MQAAKLQYGQEAWSAMSSAEKRRAVIELQSVQTEDHGPLLMIEGPTFDINAGELDIAGRTIHVDEQAKCAENQDHAVATSQRVCVPP